MSAGVAPRSKRRPVLPADGSDIDRLCIVFSHQLTLLLLEFLEKIFGYIHPDMFRLVIDLDIAVQGGMFAHGIGQIFRSVVRIDAVGGEIRGRNRRGGNLLFFLLRRLLQKAAGDDAVGFQQRRFSGILWSAV